MSTTTNPLRTALKRLEVENTRLRAENSRLTEEAREERRSRQLWITDAVANLQMELDELKGHIRAVLRAGGVEP